MAFLAKYNTATTLPPISLLSLGTRNVIASPTLAAGDVTVSKDYGAFANITTLPTVTPAAGGQVKIQLSATELQCAVMQIKFKDQTSPNEWDEKIITVYSYGNASAYLAFDFSAATQAVNVTQVDGAALGTHGSGQFPADLRQILGTAVSTPATAGVLDVNIKNIANAAVNTSSAQIGVNVVNAAGTAWGSGAITANSIATGAITNAKFAAGAIDAAAIADNAIDAGAIATGAITNAKFAAGAIDAAAIADNAIDAGAIAANAITAAKIATDAIGAAQLAADAASEIGTAVWATTTRQLTGTQSFNLTGNITGNLSGSVGSLTNERSKYMHGAVWINAAGSAGTVSYTNGIMTNPVTGIADAKTIADNLLLRRFYTQAGTTITLVATMDSYVFDGYNWKLALGGREISNSVFMNCTAITGVSTSSGATAFPYFLDSEFGATATVPPCNMTRCRFGGTVTIGASGNYDFIDCASVVAGTSTPIFDVNSVANVNISFRRWSGGITINNIAATTVISIDVVSGGTVTLNGVGGNVQVRGMCSGIVDNRTGSPTLGQNAAINQTTIATPTNITAGTITTVTNLTNAPTNGDLTATMKASIGTQVWTTSTPRTLTSISGLTADANLTQIDGVALANATFNLKKLNIVNSEGDAVVIESTGGSGRGIFVLGNGSSAALELFGGASGPAIYAQTGIGGYPDGAILAYNAWGPAVVLKAEGTGGASGDALKLVAGGAGHAVNAVAGATGNGFHIEGGATSGDAVYINALGASSGNGIYITSNLQMGIKIFSQDNGINITTKYGSTSDAVSLNAYDGDGLAINAGGSGHAINAVGGATGNALNLVGGATSGDGIAINTTDGHGINIACNRNGINILAGSGGISAIGTDGSGIYAAGGKGGCGIEAVGSNGGEGARFVGGASASAVGLVGYSSGLKIRSADAGIDVVSSAGAGASITGATDGLFLDSGSGLDLVLNTPSNTALDVNLVAVDGDVLVAHTAGMVPADITEIGTVDANLVSVDGDLLATHTDGYVPAEVGGGSTVDANVISIDGQATNGYNATLKLKALDIQNSAGIALNVYSATDKAVRISSDAVGMAAMQITGKGFGIYCYADNYGAYFEAGASGTAGMVIKSNSAAGDGLSLSGGASGYDLRATTTLLPLLDSQEVRDAMKLAPTAGAPAAGSVDEHLDTIDANVITAVADIGAVGLVVTAIEAQTDLFTFNGNAVNANVAEIDTNSSAATKLAASADTESLCTVDESNFTATSTEVETSSVVSAKDRWIIYRTGSLTGQAKIITACSLVSGKSHLTTEAFTGKASSGDTFVIV